MNGIRLVRFYLAFLLTGIIVLIGFAPGGTAHAATFAVGTAAELITAINDANLTPASDTIILSANITLTAVDNTFMTNGDNGLPVITTPIIILGEGFTLQRAGGAPQFRIFYVAGGGFIGDGDLTLDNITLNGGDIDVGTDCFLAIAQCGGAILNHFGAVTITNATFTNNTAYGGGAIFNGGGTLNITDTLFTNNTATQGGALYNTGGLIGDPATITINTNTFVDNVTVTSGGAIHNQAELFVNDSRFESNEVTGTSGFGNGGGAIYNNSFNGQIEIVNGTFFDNSAQRGGALSNYNASDVTIVNSDITNNFNVNFGEGGGIWSDNNTSLTVRNSRIDNNMTAPTGFTNGGGIYSGQNNALILENSSVSNNTANDDGGGIYMDSVNTTIISTITNSVIDFNTAGGDGGGIYKEGDSPVTINASSISNNIANGSNGGGIAIDLFIIPGGGVTINDSVIANNQLATGDGGGISVENQGIVTINRSTISGNSVTGGGGISGLGGGVFANNTNSTVTITNSTISGNTAQSNGAGVYSNNASIMSLTQVTIADNVAGLQGGGAMPFIPLNFTNTIIANNTANHPVNPQQHNCGGLAVFFVDNGNNFTNDNTTGICPAGFTVSGAINLGGLADNGGNTLTQALLPGSMAIDAAGACGLATDQRGVPRTPPCDSGAFENTVILPVVRFVTATSTIDENPGGAIGVDVILDNIAGTLIGGTVQVYVTITGTGSGNGNDFTQVTGMPLTFAVPAPGTTATQTVTFNVIPDGFIEADETIVLEITELGIVGPADIDPVGFTQHIITIFDSPIAEVEFTTAASNPNEGGGTAAELTLTVTGGTLPNGATVDIAYGGTATGSGTDYDGATTFVFSNPGGFPPGVYTFNVLTLIDDALIEGDETVTLALSNPSGGMVFATNANHTATIIDNDTFTVDFVMATDTVAEDAGNHVTQVRLVTTVNGVTPGGGQLAPGVTVNFDIVRVDLTTTGADFTGVTTATGSFTAGATDGDTFDIITPIFDDANLEGNEDYRLDLTLGALVPAGIGVTLGANPQQTVTIIDDDVPNVLVTGAPTVSESGPTSDTFSVELSTDPTATVTIELMVTDGQTLIGRPGGPYGTTLILTFEPSAGAPVAPNSFWNVAQIVEVLAIDDAAIEGTHIGQINMTVLAGSAAEYAVLNPLAGRTVVITDNDVITPTVTPPPTGTVTNAGAITLFDPAISKIGLLVPGQTGVTGEQLEWVITVRNIGSTTGTNVVVTDTLNPGLRIDTVDAPGSVVNTNGQTVTVTIPSIASGQAVQFSIFTTVTNGVTIVDNTACVTGSQGEVCATALPVTRLPQTGEIPWWRDVVLAIVGLILLTGIGLTIRRTAH